MLTFFIRQLYGPALDSYAGTGRWYVSLKQREKNWWLELGKGGQCEAMKNGQIGELGDKFDVA